MRYSILCSPVPMIQEVIRGVCILNLVEGKLPRPADRNADVRYRRLVYGAELLTRGTIDILRHAAVGELDAQGVAVRIVDDVADASAPVGNQRAVAVVQVLGAVGSLVLERARSVIVRCRLRHARQPVAVVSYYVVNSAKIHLHINNSK